MKGFYIKLFAAIMFLTICAAPVWGDEEARRIMEKVDLRDDGDRSSAEMSMLLIDRNGGKRTRKLRSFSLDLGEDRYSLMFFLSPSDVRDTGFLSLDYREAGKADDQWLYLPALKKTKRIAVDDKSGSFMGSDFNYSDLTKMRLEDYDYAFNRKKREVAVRGNKAWVIDCMPREPRVVAETGYGRLILFVRKDNYMVARAVNFEENGGYVKYYDVKKMALVDNIWTALEIHMTRKRGKRTVHKTILTLSKVRYNLESVKRNRFTIRRLEKGV